MGLRLRVILIVTLPAVVVLGVHGRGAVDRLVFGSTTHHIIREARCAVLTLRR